MSLDPKYVRQEPPTPESSSKLRWALRILALGVILYGVVWGIITWVSR